jgi:hypothetical protein
MIQKLTIFILVIIISGCCSYDKKDFDFNSTDLLPISSFKQGDTIYYESNLGDLDTILIYKIDSIQDRNCGGLMAKPAENYLFITIKHLPNDKLWTGTTTYGNTSKIRIDYQNIITIDKRPQLKEIDYSIDFKDFYTSAGGNNSIGKLRTDTININGQKVTNFYEIEHGYPERITDPLNIETVYWTNEDGLLAYKNKKGDYWVKKKRP